METCGSMLGDAMKAFAGRNAELARDVRERDQMVDALYLIVFKNILSGLKEDAGKSEESVHSLFAIKHIERLADHIVNICEEIEYIVTGTRKESGAH
jgi:phosphate transport system protein